jgi:hypothetical protein
MQSKLKMMLLAFAFVCAVSLYGQDKPATASPDFNAVADKALAAMKARAEELHINGAAVVAYSKSDPVMEWSSKMVAVGSITSTGTTNSAAENRLAIAYTKMAEMASTLKDSGSNSRPKLRGENGWQGGVVVKTRTGVVFAAFSGGPSADDLKVSRAGLAVLSDSL